MIRSRSSRDAVIALESRRMLSGNVQVTLNGSTLTITGDNSNNELAVEQTVGGLQVRAINGTKLNGTADGSLVFSNPSRINLDLLGGNDQLFLSDFLGGTVNVQMGSGNDTLTLEGINSDGALTIDLNSGNDRLEARLGGSEPTDSNVVGGNFTLQCGNGNDTVLIGALNALQNISIDGNNGNDVIGLGAGRTDGTTSILLGNGNDTAGLSDRTLVGNFSLNAGNGDDLVGLNQLEVEGASTIELGNGKDALLSQSTAFYGNVSRKGGTGTDQIFSQNDTFFSGNNVTEFELTVMNPSTIASLASRLQKLFGINLGV
ncbi:MAG: hypothetical protein DWH91_05420 [Planctomycetota bacterium]|nr:MAG: hypothetical protein DWH91_05420 [Planctomycetota bacterium]